MARRATADMSFISGSLSEKTVGNNNKMRDRDSSFSSNNYNLPPSDPHHHYLSRCTIVNDSSELSIFDAKKYFNDVSNSNNTNKVSPITNMDQIPEHPSSAIPASFSPASSSVDGYRNYRARSFHSATPTASSEASWNSQTGLLSNPPGAISVSVLRNSDPLGKKSRRPQLSSSSPSAGRWIFKSSKCPCTGKKSVQVQESKLVSEPKISPPYHNSHSKPQPPPPEPEPDVINISAVENDDDNDVVWNQRRALEPSSQVRFSPNLLLQGQTTQRVMASGRQIFTTHHQIPSSGFTFPILKNNDNNNSNNNKNTNLIDDPPRDSLEVFKPSSGRGSSPKSRILATAAASGATILSGDIDDVASDASSDLFEIESFSTQTNSTSTYPVMYHQRDSLEEARRLGLGDRRSIDEPMTPTDWYEPSEASIDWSVTTAEGFDRASVTNMSVTASEVEEFSMAMRRGETVVERRNGGGNNNSRRRSSSGNGLLSCRSEKAVNVGPNPVKYVTNGGDREGMKHVGSRPPIGNKPPLARSHSARLSLTFAA